MWSRLNSGIRRLGSTWTDDDLANPQLNAPLIKVGNTWRVEKTPDIETSNNALAVAAGGSLTIYTVTAGNLPVVAMISMSVSVAGLYTLLYNAVQFFRAIIPANTTIIIQPGRPFKFATTGNAFTLQNNTAGVSDLAGSIILSEYTP